MNIKLITENECAQIIFDRENSQANIFDGHVLAELNELLDTVSANKQLKSLIISSAKPSIFIAGADLKTLSSAPLCELKVLIELGQSVFEKLERLTITTVAAIHGACVGGGYELALACDYRVASDATCTRIGLPETQLGILPAWGGSTRLPALIGLTKALPLILSGKLLKSNSALRKGLVDGVCPQQNLFNYAKAFSQQKKRNEPIHLLTHNALAVAIIRQKSRQALLEKTQGHYPALNTALEVVCDSVRVGHHESLQNECEAILKLSAGSESTQLIRLFFLTERSKKLKIGGFTPAQLSKTAVIGSGVMGSGITYWLSTRKRHVILKDIDDEALGKAIGKIERLYAQSVTRHIMSQTQATAGLDNILPTSKDIALNECEIVIEAATENLELKKKIFSQLSEKTHPSTILATNTSALPIHELSSVVQHPERLVGIHFFNPVARMKLVEVVRTPLTSEETLSTVVRFVQSIGKLPVIVNDSPGFVVNRILLPYLVRAGELFNEGADPHRIDQEMLDFGMPMGPLRLLDEIGLDVSLHVAKTLAAAFPERMSVPEILPKMVEAGMLGKKSSTGFYCYAKGNYEPNKDALSLRKEAPSPSNIQDQLVKLMSEEAARCLDEGLVECADDIDFAMVMGTGYAPFRGGPLRHAHDSNLLCRTFYKD